MKKLILLLVIIMPMSIYAQRFHGGLIGGFNVSQIDGDAMYGFNKAGLVGGAFVFTDFTEKWGALMEIRYSAKGSATPKNDLRNIRIRLQYIEIPLVVKYEIVKKLDIQAGISFGYLFNAARDDGYGYVKFENLDNRTDLLICAGLSYSIFEKFDIGIRYSYSMFPIAGRYANANYDTGALFNSVVTFGFYFILG